MTDESNSVVATDTNSIVSQPQSSPSESFSTSEDSSHAQNGKYFTQDHIDNIVKQAKSKAYEKGKREASGQVSMDGQNQASGMGGMPGISHDEIERLVADKVKNLHEQTLHEQTQATQYAAAQRTAQDFFSKLEKGKEKYSDYMDVTKPLKFDQMGPIVLLANQEENTPDIIYDLAKNPQKIANLMILAHTQPDLAAAEMKRLGASIKANEAAQLQTSPRSPLSQVTPSPTGIGNENTRHVRDFRKASWAKA